EHGGVRGQQVLCLLRVDVDPAGDDHVALAIGEVQVSVSIDVTDVADGAGGSVWAAALRGFRRILKVLERGRAAEPDQAIGADRGFVAVLVEYEQLTEYRTADRAGMSEPLGRVAERQAVELSGPVILGDDRPEPVDHCPFEWHRAWRGRV